MIYAFDSNIISYILKEDDVIISKYRQEIVQGNDVIIPPTAFYEIQRGLLAKRMFAKLRAFELFCQKTSIGNINFTILLKAAQIYAELNQKGLPVGGDGDIFIAAFCIVNDYTLVTNNTRHFKNINGLKLSNWKE